MRAEIPRFLACKGARFATPENLVDLPSIDVPVEDGKTKRGALMFSTSDKAREFIERNGGESAFHLCHTDYPLLEDMLATSHVRQFECIVIDYINNGKRGFIK